MNWNNLEKLWPPELLYWHDLGSRQITDYLKQTPQGEQLVLIPWGTLEAFGPWLQVGHDSKMAQIVTDLVALRLLETHGVQPVIFNSYIDVGSYSATRGFPGAVAITDWEKYHKPDDGSPILYMWERVLQRLRDEGFSSFFIVNGDGGNWQNFMERSWHPDVVPITEYLQAQLGVKLGACNWDQEGVSWPHASHYTHACTKWLCDYAPERERLAALRVNLRAAPEDKLKEIEGKHLPDNPEKRRRSSWAEFSTQQERDLRGVNRFFLAEYLHLLYEPDAKTPRTSGGIEADFSEKVDFLYDRVSAMLDLS